MSILEEMLEMFATTVQAELNATLRVCESGLHRGTLKGKTYANKPRTIQELEKNIRSEIAAISEDVLLATFANMKRSVQLCLDSGGEYFQHLL